MASACTVTLSGARETVVSSVRRKSSSVFARQGGDEVHVDVRKARLAGEMVGRDRLLRGVCAADAPERFVVERLRVDGDARRARAQKHFQHGAVDGVRPAGLHGLLHRAGEGLARGENDLLQSLAGDGGGRAAAHVEGAGAQTLLRHDLRAEGDLAFQGLHIGVHQMPVADFARGKGAVGAASFAEGNADVNVKSALRRRAHAHLHLVHFVQQLRAVFGDVEHVHKRAHRVEPLLQGLIIEPRGADAGQRTPRGVYAGQLFAVFVQRQLHGALAQPLLFQFARAVRVLQTEHGHRPAAELVAPVPVLAGNGVFDAQVGLASLVEEDRRAAVEQAQYVGHVLHKARFRGKNADGHSE